MENSVKVLKGRGVKRERQAREREASSTQCVLKCLSCQ